MDFLNNQWLGGALVKLLQLPVSTAGKLKAKISDFLINGVWCLPNDFKQAFLAS